MTSVDIAGLGLWSRTFSDWETFRQGLASGAWPAESQLQPARIPPRERRRAPLFVKMAIEVMDQACGMAGLEPDDIAVVFSSSMGDMQITDYMCRALAETPQLISPTRFHNSVHNAAPGYWSIATASFAPASAVSARENTAAMAFLEAAIQVVEERTPVVVVMQEMAAPMPLQDVCPSTEDFAAALLLVPPGTHPAPLATLDFSHRTGAADSPALAAALENGLGSNYGARLLPLITALAGGSAETSFDFPLSPHSSLAIAVIPGRSVSDPDPARD